MLNPTYPHLPDYEIGNFRDLGIESNPTANLEAIVVPSARGASHLEYSAQRALHSNLPLVVMCSGDTDHEQAAKFLSDVRPAKPWKQPRLQYYAVQLPPGYSHELFDFTAQNIIPDDLKNPSDLALKRNIAACLLERFFNMDDDMYVTKEALDAVGSLMAANAVVGLKSVGMVDKSVIHHALDQAKLFLRHGKVTRRSQNISGNSMAINTQQHVSHNPLEIYNEDWLMLWYVLRNSPGKTHVADGEAIQKQFDPFAQPDRPRREEFGDTMVEGLYRHRTQKLPQEMLYGKSYWQETIRLRRELAQLVLNAFNRPATEIGTSYMNSDIQANPEKWIAYRRMAYIMVEGALEKILAYNALIDPELCTTYIRQLDEDQQKWDERYRRWRDKYFTPGNIMANLSSLGLSEFVLSSEAA
ncbi:hypothetical protein JNM87_00415 [Candidatus Saccharibacteria bacterium]|nr:hypothetical protein [Candidatus Saccharibacteria bacterium]